MESQCENFLSASSTTILSSSSNAIEQIIVGIVLGTKALTQLVMAPIASTCVARYGPCLVLRLSTATLAVAALSKFIYPLLLMNLNFM